jgi:hypothetical protein
LSKFDKIYELLKMKNMDISTHSRKKYFLRVCSRTLWVDKNQPRGNLTSWFNIKASFMEKLGLSTVMAHSRNLALLFKQKRK